MNLSAPGRYCSVSWRDTVRKKLNKIWSLVSKSAATNAQVTFALLFLQYILLAVAIFWPLGVITMILNRPAIDFPKGNLPTTSTPTPPSQTRDSQTYFKFETNYDAR
jgi:hypothetical protein